MLNVTPNSAEKVPAALAETIAALAATITNDAEIAAVLRQAREQLQAIGWNRYARRISHQSAIDARTRNLRRRHQGARQHRALWERRPIQDYGHTRWINEGHGDA